MDKFDKFQNESDTDYKLRIGLACVNNEMTWNNAQKYLNAAFNVNYGESAWRKHFKQWYEGYQYGRKEYNPDIDMKILCIQDLHIPFQKPIETFVKYKQNVDILQINGDILDCQNLQSFDKNWRQSPMSEIITARQYLIDLIRYIKPAQVVVNRGNHDCRLKKYIAKHLDTDISELMPESPLDLIFDTGFTHYDSIEGSKVQYSPLSEIFPNIIKYNATWYSQIGKTIFCHPLTYNSGIMKTAESARRYFKDEGYNFDCLIMAHTHRIGRYDIGDTIMYEQGCCCDTQKMLYNSGRLVTSQREGYMFVAQDKDGKLIEDYTRLIRLN